MSHEWLGRKCDWHLSDMTEKQNEKIWGNILIDFNNMKEWKPILIKKLQSLKVYDKLGNYLHRLHRQRLLLSHQVVSDSAASLPAAHQASLAFTVSQSLLRFMSIEWCCLTISPSASLFSFAFKYFPASGSFPISQSSQQVAKSIGVSASASVLPMNTQGWLPLGLAGWISLQSKGLTRVFSNTTVQKHQFFSARPSLCSSSHICTWLPENHSFDYTDLCWQSDVSAFEYAV